MPYQLEYKRTVDSTYTVWSSTLTAAQFPQIITGLQSGTQYDMRCKAIDGSGNSSAYSAVTQASTTGSIVWQSVPTVTFTKGGGNQTFSYRSLVAPASGLSFTDNSGTIALPTGVVDNTTLGRYEYTDSTGVIGGSNGHIITADDAVVSAESDWTARSTAAGVTFATDFRSTNDFQVASTSSGGRGKWGSGTGPLAQSAYYALVTRDTTDGVTGGACLRIDSPIDASANGAAWMCSLNPTWTTKAQGMGSTPFWISFRQKVPASRLTTQPGTNNGLSDGQKMMILAGYSPTDPANGSLTHMGPVHVVQNQNWRNYPNCYRYDQNNSAQPFGEIYYSALNSFIDQDAIDKGSQFTDAARYCIRSNPISCFLYYPGEWVTYKWRYKMQTLGSSTGTGNEFDMWAARPGATSWTHLYSDTGFGLLPNDPGWDGGVNGLWLSAFETNRVGGSVVTYQLYDQVIISTQDIALPSS